MKYELFKQTIAYTYEKIETIEPFHEQFNLKRVDFFSTSIKSNPVDEEIKREEIIVIESNMTVRKKTG